MPIHSAPRGYFWRNLSVCCRCPISCITPPPPTPRPPGERASERAVSRGLTPSRLTFLSSRLTFLSSKLTFLSSKLTFLSSKLAFLSSKHSVFPWIPLQRWLFAPELQWQPRGTLRIWQGWYALSKGIYSV